MDFTAIMNISVLCISILLLVTSFIRLYRWRKSAFDSTNAYLRNLRYIQPGEVVCIQAPDKPGLQYSHSKRSKKTWVYWEYHYTVDGVPYCKSYFYEDDEEHLLSKVKIHYNRKNPKLMYREGAIREGVLISVFTIFIGTFFLAALVASYIV